jgi:ATP-dependent helicase/nuclease subunit B
MSDLFGRPSPRWLTIPAHRPFLEDLAAALWRELSPGGPEALADALVLLPTRRAARALAESFLKAADARAAILPQIRVLGDLDEGEPPFEAGGLGLDLPPAITPHRRRFELAGLVAANQELLGRRLEASGALELADALGSFLDTWQIEEPPVGADRVFQDLADGEFARHWRISAAFLDIALKTWPARLEALGLMDIAARRIALLRRLASDWTLRPPGGVVVAAGSTGSAPASAALLAAIGRAPRGAVVLPGLDRDLAEAAWREVEDQHPQSAMRRLLQAAGVDRSAVTDLDPATAAQSKGRWRRRLINEALRPPDSTADWVEVIKTIRAEGPGVDPLAEGLEGLSVVAGKTEEEAAALAALLLRETLATPDKTAAFICPDADLARRVSARLLRWNIGADSSAGQPLAGSRPAILAGLVAKAVADPSDPVTLLAIIKHPLTILGLDESALTRGRNALERRGLRGPRPESFAALIERLQEAPAEALDLAERLGAALMIAQAPFVEAPGEAGAIPPAQAARALVLALERLAAGPRGGLGGLWAGAAGEALARLLSALIRESDGLPPVNRDAFARLLGELLAAETLRPGGASHPRLRILGVLEARLVRADRIILAGLEEGVWPQGAPIDPFLSRPMRGALGLPAPERRIGLSAHDFAQAACAPEVVLIRTLRRGGAPTVASRWLWRLEVLAKGAWLELPGRPGLANWARRLDGPLADPPPALRPAIRPAPKPPVAARPRRLGVTAVEQWLRDPYGLYARHILKLRPLERPDEEVDARARGTAIHKAFERFALTYPDALPESAEAEFAALLTSCLREAGMTPARMARESALAANAAGWAVAFEQRRRPGARLFVEQTGELTLAAPGGPFVLTAKADRLEVRGRVADILDFKTGTPPTKKQVAAHLTPQLSLTAAILAGGGFSQLGPLSAGELLYVRVTGGRVPGQEVRCDEGDAGDLADEVFARLHGLIARFDEETTPYAAWTLPQFIHRYGGDYDHLARLWEWHVLGEASAEGEA